MSSPDEEDFSVCYRTGPLTARDYDEAIEALQAAKSQMKPDGNGCAICTDNGHQAMECHHNPLRIVRQLMRREASWRCFHCGQIFYDSASAQEHFEETEHVKPICLRDDPQFDCTPAAHPAWWRGHEHSARTLCAAVTAILNGKSRTNGVANEPWQTVRERLYDFRDQRADQHYEPYSEDLAVIALCAWNNVPPDNSYINNYTRDNFGSPSFAGWKRVAEAIYNHITRKP